MASVPNTNAAVRAKNGLGSTTHIMTFDDTTTTPAATALAEAQSEGFTVAAVQGTTDGDYFALQGTGTPSITDCTLVATFS